MDTALRLISGDSVIDATHEERVRQSLLALRKTNVVSARRRLDFGNAAKLEVMFSRDEWTPFPHMDGILTRVTHRDEDQKIIGMVCRWVRSGFINEHYHDAAEEIVMTSGSLTLFLEEPDGTVIQVDLKEGDSITVPSKQKHAGFAHAGTVYKLSFHPPMVGAD